MKNSKRLDFILEKGVYYNSILTQYLLYDFENLKISDLLKEDIRTNINDNKSFELPISNFNEIQKALDQRIEELLKHSDFNPFKEELRLQFPDQYGDQPFVFNGETYYLHTKTFPIDSLIDRIIDFKALLEEHLKLEKTLKYVYKE